MGSHDNHRLGEAKKIMNKQSKMTRALWLGCGVVLAGFLQGCAVPTVDSNEDSPSTEAEEDTGTEAAALLTPESTVDFETYFSLPQTKQAVRREPPLIASRSSDPDGHAVRARSKTHDHGLGSVPSASTTDRISELVVDNQPPEGSPPPNPWRSRSTR
jgi:hypothetical protein